MPNYRRAFVAGGCWFFTVNLFDRKSRLLVEHIDFARFEKALAEHAHSARYGERE
jgi:putative transposase